MSSERFVRTPENVKPLFQRIKGKAITELKPKPSRLYRNPIAFAQEWQRALGNGDCSSPAELARKLGVSRARVTQVLRLLRLAPEVLEVLVSLGDPLSDPIVTERKLRPILNLPAEEQRWRVDVILSGSRSQKS